LEYYSPAIKFIFGRRQPDFEEFQSRPLRTAGTWVRRAQMEAQHRCGYINAIENLMYPCAAHGMRMCLRGTPLNLAYLPEKPSNFMDFPIDFLERLCYTVILDIEVT